MSAVSSLPARVWARIQEPRLLSVIYFVIYGAASVAGVAVLMDPPLSMQNVALTQTLVVYWGSLLLAGGALGLASVLPGWWWVERVGALSCVVGVLLYWVAIGAQPITQHSTRALSLCFILIASLTFAARMVKIRRYAYDPEK